MFDISWTEFLLIGVVALVVIGPKELPGVMRTLGQYTRKIRGMAADFQGQFQEAMREAEMADLKKSVDDLAQDIKSYDPLKGAREDVEAMGKDFNKDLGKEFENKPLDLMTPHTPSAEPSAPGPTTEQPSVEPVVAEPAGVEPVIARASTHTSAVESAPQPSAPEPAVATPESTERTG
jgi:sec-independent protein translocase protein TatB